MKPFTLTHFFKSVYIYICVVLCELFDVCCSRLTDPSLRLESYAEL